MACEDDESFWCFHRKLGICRLVKYIFVKNPLQSGCRQIGRKYSNSEPAALLANTGVYWLHLVHQHTATGDGILPRVMTQDCWHPWWSHQHPQTLLHFRFWSRHKKEAGWLANILVRHRVDRNASESAAVWWHVSAPDGNINCQQRQCHDPSAYAITISTYWAIELLSPHIELLSFYPHILSYRAGCAVISVCPAPEQHQR